MSVRVGQSRGAGGWRALRALLLMRLLFGYYSTDLLPGRRSRILAILHCLFLTSITFYFFIYYYLTISRPIVVGFEIMSLTTVSALFQKVNFSDYFFRVQNRCKMPKSKKHLMCLALLPFLIAFLFSIIYSILVVSNALTAGVLPLVSYAAFGMAHISIVFGESPKIIALGLLYLDTRALLQFVRTQPTQVHAVIFMYEKIQMEFRKFQIYTKILIALGVIGAVLKVVSIINIELKHSISIPYITILLISTLVVWAFLTAFLPLVLLEMIANLEEEIVVQLLNRRIVTTEPNLRRALGEAVRFMRTRPLRFSILDAVPLDGKLALSLVSVTTTYGIALLQLVKLTGNTAIQTT